jgi:hypothetical protein
MTVPGHVYRLSWHGGLRCYCHDRTDAANAEAQPAYVAEYQQVGAGVLYRVVNVPVHGIMYVHRSEDGFLRAETFGGKPVPVPAEARDAVTSYVSGKEAP